MKIQEIRKRLKELGSDFKSRKKEELLKELKKVENTRQFHAINLAETKIENVSKEFLYEKYKTFIQKHYTANDKKEKEWSFNIAEKQKKEILKRFPNAIFDGYLPNLRKSIGVGYNG